METFCQIKFHLNVNPTGFHAQTQKLEHDNNFVWEWGLGVIVKD